MQRPRILEGMALDLFLVRSVAAAADAYAGLSQKLAPLVDEFAGRVFAEARLGFPWEDSLSLLLLITACSSSPPPFSYPSL